MSDMESEIPNPRQTAVTPTDVIPPATVDKIRFEEPSREKLNDPDSLSPSSSRTLDFDPDEIAQGQPNPPTTSGTAKPQHNHQHFDWHHPFDIDFHNIHLPHPHVDWRHHHHEKWTGKELPRRESAAHAMARAEAASWAQMTPLIAATLGPLAVLLGIASLTQRWHGLALDPPVLPSGYENFVELPDPTINIILGVFTLVCEVLGNFLLVLRFSNFHTRITTWASYLFWIAKVIFGLANYIQFGITNPETGEVIYLQGYWVLPFIDVLIARRVFAVWQ